EKRKQEVKGKYDRHSVCHLLSHENQTGRSAWPTMKPIIVIFGIVVAAFGGVIAYRALFLEPSAAVVITNTEIRELPNYTRVVGGIGLVIAGAAIAFFTAIRKK